MPAESPSRRTACIPRRSFGNRQTRSMDLLPKLQLLHDITNSEKRRSPTPALNNEIPAYGSLLTRPLHHRRGRRPPLVEGLQLPSEFRPHRRWFPARPRRFAIFLIVRFSPLSLARIPAVSPGAQQILHVSARVLGADHSFGVASGAGRLHRRNTNERAEAYCD